MLIHGFWLVNAQLLMAFGTAFYAIIIFNDNEYTEIVKSALQLCIYKSYIITLRCLNIETPKNH